jgi:hypothetical protein
MKRLLYILPLVVLLCGCQSSNTPMSSVVQEFHTSDVRAVPYTTSQFIVRDTNGTVWFTDTHNPSVQSNGYFDYICYRQTLLFDNVKKVDKLKLEE